MIVPTRKNKAHELVYQRLTIIDREGALVVLLRFRDDGVPFSGRDRNGVTLARESQ